MNALKNANLGESSRGNLLLVRKFGRKLVHWASLTGRIRNAELIDINEEFVGFWWWKRPELSSGSELYAY